MYWIMDVVSLHRVETSGDSTRAAKTNVWGLDYLQVVYHTRSYWDAVAHFIAEDELKFRIMPAAQRDFTHRIVQSKRRVGGVWASDFVRELLEDVRLQHGARDLRDLKIREEDGHVRV